MMAIVIIIPMHRFFAFLLMTFFRTISSNTTMIKITGSVNMAAENDSIGTFLMLS